MNHFVNIPDSFNPHKHDFDNLNPQIKFIPPFSILYKENKEEYNELMWACTFMCHPDDSKNLLYRLPEEERKEAISENYFEVDWEDPLLQKCIEEYPQTCLTSVQRALKDEKEFLLKRGLFLKNTEYNLNTMKDIDAAVSKTPKIYENFEQLEEKYLNEKAKGSEVFGGRTETLAEQKRL